MKIAIVGAGAVGCLLAARLSEAGHALTLVGRPTQVEAISSNGLLLHDPRGNATRYRLNAVLALREHPDLVLLTVKTLDVEQACRQIEPYVGGVPVVTMQNGVQADHMAAAVLGREAVLGAVVMCAASYLQPGEVSVQFAGWLIVGEPFGGVRGRTRAIAAVLSGAMPAYLTSHLWRARWSKLVFNLNNAICAATGLPLPEIAQTPAGRHLSIAVMKEGYRVARAAGLRLDHGLYGLTPRALRQDPNAALIALLQGTMSTVLATLPERAAMSVAALAGRSRLSRLPIRFSMWQSIARGRPTEIEYLNGEIVRRGHEAGLPTPYNTRLVAAVHEVAESGRFLTIAELLPSHAAQTTRVSPVGGVR